MNTQETAVTPQRGHGTSRIELLYAALIAADKAYEAYDEASLKTDMRDSAADDHAADAYVSETDAIYDALSFQSPATPHEIDIMLRALDFHVDLLLRTAPVSDDEEAQARGEKALRILKAVRDALPSRKIPERHLWQKRRVRSQILIRPATPHR